jgi:membrane protein YqaA with SNARE-associated domain
MIDITAYAGLCFSAFIAATLLPMQSEAVLVGLIVASKQSPVLLIVVASLGNILGAVINWLMGRGIERFKDRTWFPAKGAVLERAQNWYSRYGKWSLLLSWLPIIGDPLTVIAGVMREPLRTFIVLVAIGKITRYIFIAAVTLKAM